MAQLLFDSCQVIKDARDSVMSSIRKFFVDPAWKYRDHGDYSDHEGDLIDPARKYAEHGDDSNQQANMDVCEKIHITGAVFNFLGSDEFNKYCIDVLLYVGEALPFIHAFCIHLEKTQDDKKSQVNLKSQTEQSQQSQDDQQTQNDQQCQQSQQSQDDQQSQQNQGGRQIQDDQQTQATSCGEDTIFIYRVFLV